MDIGSICLCLAIGALIVFVSIGIGVCFGRIFGCDKGHNKGQLRDDSDMRIYVYSRSRSGRGHNGYDLSDEALADILRTMVITGMCTSPGEKEYLKEAANRLERSKK